jgi:hypothetical protein
MPRCPVCQSPKILIVLSADPRAVCEVCGSHWVQQGERQTAIKEGRRTVDPVQTMILRLGASDAV